MGQDGMNALLGHLELAVPQHLQQEFKVACLWHLISGQTLRCLIWVGPVRRCWPCNHGTVSFCGALMPPLLALGK